MCVRAVFEELRNVRIPGPYSGKGGEGPSRSSFFPLLYARVQKFSTVFDSQALVPQQNPEYSPDVCT